MRVVATAAALMALPVLTNASAEGNRSLTEIESRIGNSRTQVPDPDSNTIGALKEKLLLAETTIAALTATVAEMGNSAEASRRELEDAKLRLEQSGSLPEKSESAVLETRLLQSLRELRILKESNNSARRQLLMLCEAIQMLLLTSGETNPQARMAVETELRKASDILGDSSQVEAKPLEANLNEAIVIDTKDDIGLAVINVGKAHGVKVGMQFDVFRNSELINTITIVDAREKISGAVIQSLVSNNVRVEQGDTLKVVVKK